MKKIFKIPLIIISFSAVGFLSYNFGFSSAKDQFVKIPPQGISNAESEASNKADFSVFWEAWNMLESDYLDKEKIDYQKMVYGAINGIVESLGDPYTTFFSPKETEEFEEELSGKYEGVGMEIGMRDDKITVISPIEGTPAFEAGMKPNDKILKINDVSTEGISLEEAVSMIRGPKETEVTLLVDRKDWASPKPVILKRGLIKIPTFKWEIIETKDGQKNPIAYIKIYQFNRILLSEIKNAASKIVSSSAKKIILDLRNNPGGYLDVAQEVAGWFLERGDIVVLQDFGQEKEKKAYKTQGTGVFLSYPAVILINEGSASAAEILAGALRDNRGVKLIGEKSFGKGSVQEQIFLMDDSSLKITIARWLTPNGYSINEKGLIPDIEAEFDDEKWNQGIDSQLDKALEAINLIQELQP